MIKNFFLALLLLTSYTYLQAQGTCYSSQGCSDYSNFGYNSSSALNLEYDNYVSAWHSSAVRDIDGTLKIWGEMTKADGVNAWLVPTPINAGNYPGLTGTPLKLAMASSHQNYVQFILLTDDGKLWAWGKEDLVVDNSLTSSSSFQQLSIGLPVGVSASQVKMMTAFPGTALSSKTGGLAITTCAGNVYVLAHSTSAAMRGNGTASSTNGVGNTTWYQVQKNTGGPLTGIVATRTSGNAVIALDNAGKLWTWGHTTWLGDGNGASAANTKATPMTLPGGSGPIKMIGVCYGYVEPVATDRTTYYVLYENGSLYALGSNSYGQIGDWSTTSSNNWVQPRYGSASGTPMNDIKWISPNENDNVSGFINVINNAKQLYNWGTESGYDLGRGVQSSNNGFTAVNPGMPVSFEGSYTNSGIIAVESGGHTTMVLKECVANFGYAGHRINGSMGDGSTTEVTDNIFHFDTNAVQVCGANTAPAVKDLKMCPTTTVNLANAHIGAVPTGLTLAWYTTNNQAPGTQVSNPSAVGPGVYYAFYQGGCPNPVAAKVTVSYYTTADPEFSTCFTPFTCNSNFYLSQYPAGGPTTLYTLNNTTNPFTITSVGTSPAGYTVNGIGYNTVDKYMYGIYSVAAGDNRLIKIDANGTMTDLGIINTLPNTGYNNGTFDNAGNLYTSRYGTDKFYKINVTTKVATEIVLSRTIQVNDLVYDQSTGKFFGYEGAAGTDRLISINLTSATAGTVTNLPTSNLPAGSTFGAMYIDSNGDIFGNEDNTGSGFYQFDKTTGTAVKISTSIKAFGNDGANCPDAIITFPADLSVTKTDGKTSYIPGTINTYTIVVSNASGPYGVLGATVSDLLPAGIPAANMSYSVPVLTGGATTSITGLQTGALNDVVGLPVGSTITYTVTINVPMAYIGNLTNTVTVTPPASTSSDPTPGNNTATDTDAYNCGGKDSDGDGIGDICDLDDDNDGIPDCIENGFDGNPNTVFKSNGSTVASSNSNPANGPQYQFRLTNTTNQQGQAWSYGKIDFANSFILSMKAKFSDADGIAMVFHNDPLGTNAIGVSGQGLGARGIANGIALELDTFVNSCNNDVANGQNCDPSFDHGSIRTTAGWIGAGKLAGDGQLGDGTIDDGLWHDVVVYWNASIRRLSYNFDGAEVTSYIFPTSGANSIETILGGKTTATFGYTGSTGSNGNANTIGFDNPCTIPIFFDTDGDGINDHLDLDSDNDGCVDALEGDERVTTAQLVTAGGTVVVGTGSTASNQNLCANGTCVDAQGVPKIVNAGGTTDVGNDQGQGIGSSQNSAVSACNAIPCNTEYVTNGTFATNLTGWTGDIDWIYESGKAKMYSENVTNKVLSQTLHNLDRISNNTVSLTLELGTQDYNQASGGIASLDILLDGVVYATINNGTLRNSSNVTMALYGGATSDFVTFGTSAVSGFTYKTFTLNIPYLGSSSAALTFRASAANGDDWSLDNISVVEKCSYCVKPGDFSVAGTPTKVGITNQTKLTGWPESVPNGHIVLESKDKGFVITRVLHVSTTPDLVNDSVKDPKEGMIIYDIQDKCVKLFNGSTWKCIQRSCNDGGFSDT